MARWFLLALAAACSRDVPTVPVCEPGRPAAAVAAELAASLPADGWRDVVVERHPRIVGRWLVRGVRDAGTHIAGRIDDSAEASCRGARVSLSVLDVPAGAARKTAGPAGLSRPSRLPDSLLTR